MGHQRRGSRASARSDLPQTADMWTNAGFRRVLQQLHGPTGTACREEVLMRSALIILAVVAVQIAAPAQAQTYDPNYPVCLQVYDDMVHYYFECSYTSMAQCAASASGRSTR